jgi:hypothetical protein
MDLLKQLMDTAGGAGVEPLARQFGLKTDQAQQVIGQLLPALGQGVQRNVSQAGGLESLSKGLAKGNHQRYLDNPAELLGAADEGNPILGHTLGSKDVSRNVVAHADSETGIDAGLIKKMLPMVAAMAMGALSRQTNGGQQLETGGADLLGSLLGGGEGGTDLGDVPNLARKFF